MKKQLSSVKPRKNGNKRNKGETLTVKALYIIVC